MKYPRLPYGAGHHSRRLQGLLLLAVALASVAVALNVRYWQQRAAAQAAERRAAALRNHAPDPRLAEIEALTKRLARQPKDAAARLRLAELCFQVGDYRRSLEELQALKRERPQDPDLLLRAGMALKFAGQPAEAEGAFRRALALRPNLDVARAWLAEVCLDRGRPREALQLFNECLQRQPENVLALVGKSRAMEELFKNRHPISIPEMVQPVEKAVQLDPKNRLGLLVLARLQLVYLRQPEIAEPTARRAAALDPASPGPYILLAEIALSYPPTPETLQRAGVYAYEAGRRNLRDPRPAAQLGRVYLLQNDVPRAIRALERSVALGATPEAVSQLSVAYRRAGNGQQADRYASIYQRYRELTERRDALLRERVRQPEEVGRYYALAELYLEARQPEIAANWLRAARRVRPGDPRYRRLTARVQQLRDEKGNVPLLPIQ